MNTDNEEIQYNISIELFFAILHLSKIVIRCGDDRDKELVFSEIYRMIVSIEMWNDIITNKTRIRTGAYELIEEIEVLLGKCNNNDYVIILLKKASLVKNNLGLTNR
jgi:hypothetical protein